MWLRQILVRVGSSATWHTVPHLIQKVALAGVPLKFGAGLHLLICFFRYSAREDLLSFEQNQAEGGWVLHLFFFFFKFFIRVCLCRSSSCSKIQMWQKDAAVLSKAAAAESEEGSGDGGGAGGGGDVL